MITAIVRFKLPEGTARQNVIEAFKASAPKYQGIPGHVRKYYLYGDQGIAGGVYLWESRESAEAVYTADWRRMIADRYGSEPQVSYFDTPVVVDNLSEDVVAEAAQ